MASDNQTVIVGNLLTIQSCASPTTALQYPTSAWP